MDLSFLKTTANESCTWGYLCVPLSGFNISKSPAMKSLARVYSENIAQITDPLLLQLKHFHPVRYPPTSPQHFAEHKICHVETTSLVYLQW